MWNLHIGAEYIWGRGRVGCRLWSGVRLRARGV